MRLFFFSRFLRCSVPQTGLEAASGLFFPLSPCVSLCAFCCFASVFPDGLPIHFAIPPTLRSTKGVASLSPVLPLHGKLGNFYDEELRHVACLSGGFPPQLGVQDSCFFALSPLYHGTFCRFHTYLFPRFFLFVDSTAW